MTEVTLESGCYVDNHWGQYAVARVVKLAVEFGRQCKLDENGHCSLCVDEDLATRHLAAMGPSDKPGLNDTEFEMLVAAADDAEEWLNDNIKLEGHAWSWYEGDFGLYELEEE